MSTNSEHLSIHNNKDKQRYEVQVEGHTAVLEYKLHGNTITYIHTEVPAEIERHGVGSELAHTALEDARKEHLHVIARCPFVAAYIREHTEYQDLLQHNM